jgi:hypothetical protein
MLRLRLSDTSKSKALTADDVMVLVMNGPVWQYRHAATPTGDGVYEMPVTFPSDGGYMVMVESRSHGLQFSDLDPAKLWVGPPPSQAVAPGSGEGSVVKQ